MLKMCKYIIIISALLLLVSAATAETAEPVESSPWSLGLSVISPGLPIACKAVYSPSNWGVQLEMNYFYTIGMFRIDGRSVVVDNGWNALYGFIGLTAMHLNDGLQTTGSIDNSLMADLGVGGELRFGRRRAWSLGFEGGLLIPFYSSRGLDQFDDSGLLVANLFLLYTLPGSRKASQ